MKVALLYDWLNRWGGAERVLKALLGIWPRATLFSAVYDPARAYFLKNYHPRTSFLQNWPLAKKKAFLYYPLLGRAFAQFNFDDYDLVISLSSGPAKAALTKPGTFHLHYCLTPPRWLWQRNLSPWPKLFPFLSYWRQQDFIFAQRPDAIFSISRRVAARVWKYYHRHSLVVYPGINLKRFSCCCQPPSPQAPFLVVSRLVTYKRVDLVIQTFNKLGWPLLVVGQGRCYRRWSKLARANIKFLGMVEEQRLRRLYCRSRALIMPQEEDFGLVALEAMASGRPVISYRQSGAVEALLPGKTGLTFAAQTVAGLTTTLRQFQKMQFDPRQCRRQAEKFSQRHFQEKFAALVAKERAAYLRSLKKL